MNNAMLFLLIALGIVAVDTAAVSYGVHIGMRYPFIAAAVVNVAITFLAHLTGIAWMLNRSDG